jgi:dolichol-phosphate mannosyltransferase
MSASALVVIPTYNERANLPVLVAGLMRHPGVRVLVVDDQSPDGTGELADALAREHAGRIQVMHRTGKRGFGRSYIDGIKQADWYTEDWLDRTLSAAPMRSKATSAPPRM